MPQILQSRTHHKHRSPKTIFFLALAALILAIGLSIYVFCRGQSSTVPMGRIGPPAGEAGRPSPTEIISLAPSLSPIPPISPISHIISYVHDGDTIYTRDFKPGIRLLGIDAPELAGSYRCGQDADCTDTIEECGATAAKNKLKELVLKKEVVLVEDETVGATDKYNRWLRYVYICRERSRPFLSPAAGGTWGGSRPTPTNCLDIDLELIRLGLSRESGFGNSYEKQKIYQEAENEAKTKRLGIWGTCYK